MPPPRFVGGIGGTPIVFETPTAGPTKPSEPSIRVRLTVVRGRNQGSTSELQMAAKLVIGRRSGCDLALSDDETVSSEHCEISWSNNRLVIRDLHSSNGTLVNGVPISGDQPLENGDRVGIGKTEYRVGVVSGSL
jgi:pSer/pThr/pTyr-binding forkhead associated (FHA) protein